MRHSLQFYIPSENKFLKLSFCHQGPPETLKLNSKILERVNRESLGEAPFDKNDRKKETEWVSSIYEIGVRNFLRSSKSPLCVLHIQVFEMADSRSLKIKWKILQCPSETSIMFFYQLLGRCLKGKIKLFSFLTSFYQKALLGPFL